MRYNRKKSGQGLVEYALIIGLITIVCIALLTQMGGTVGNNILGNVQTAVEAVESNP